MEDEKVKQLAETLKKQGLAVSMYEATEKAKSILNVKQGKTSEEKDPQRFSKQGYDVKNEEVTVNELMEEVGVTQEQVQAQEKIKIDKVSEDISQIKEDITEAQENPEKVEHIKEEISQVNEEINEIVEERTGDVPDQSAEQKDENKKDSEQKDRFKQEKNIDLSKIFSSSK